MRFACPFEYLPKARITCCVISVWAGLSFPSTGVWLPIVSLLLSAETMGELLGLLSSKLGLPRSDLRLKYHSSRPAPTAPATTKKAMGA